MDVREDLLRMLRRGRIDEFNDVSARRQHIIDLSNAELTEARIEGADFRGVTLDGVKLQRAHLGGCDFRGASLRFSNLEAADLEGADFTKANLYSAYLARAKMSGATIHGADVCAAVFPDDLHPEEIRLSHEKGTRLRHDPTVALLRQIQELLGRGAGPRS